MKSKLETYALAVCFAAVICIVIYGGMGGYALVEIIEPELTLNSFQYQQYADNDSYWRSRQVFNPKDYSVRPDEDVLTKQRAQSFAAAVQGEKIAGIQSLIKAVIFILFGGVALLVHWRIARRARGV